MRIWPIIFCVLLAIVSIFMQIEEGISWIAMLGVIMGILGLFLYSQKDTLNNSTVKRKKSRNAILKSDCIFFPKGYYFKHGYLKNKKELPYDIIEEFRINTTPTTAKINGNELIFLLGIKDDVLLAIANNQDIKVVEPRDNWTWICEPFLDTEVDEEEHQGLFESLADSGIPEKEVVQIREKISSKMLSLTSATWEWAYYGQYDVLNQFMFLSEKTYWWTMEIALRQKTT